MHELLRPVLRLLHILDGALVMLCESDTWTDLRAYLENVLKAHAGVGELALEQHDDVAVVLVDLLVRCTLGAIALFKERL